MKAKQCCILFACVVLCSCGRYPATETPPNALSRDVTVQLDKDIGERKVSLTVFAPEGSDKIPMAAGPKVEGGGYALTFDDGVRIRFDHDVTIKGTTFGAGTELVKVNGWWCRPD